MFLILDQNFPTRKTYDVEIIQFMSRLENLYAG